MFTINLIRKEDTISHFYLNRDIGDLNYTRACFIIIIKNIIQSYVWAGL